MSHGRSITTSIERFSGTVSQSRHVRRTGTGTILTTEDISVVKRPVGFVPPRDPREYGESLWTARDIL